MRTELLHSIAAIDSASERPAARSALWLRRGSSRSQGRASRAGAAAGARFARVLAAPHGHGARARRSAQACGPSYEAGERQLRASRGAGSRGTPPAFDLGRRSSISRSERQLRAWFGPRVPDHRQHAPVARPSRQPCDSFAVTSTQPRDSSVTLSLANHGGERRILAIRDPGDQAAECEERRGLADIGAAPHVDGPGRSRTSVRRIMSPLL